MPELTPEQTTLMAEMRQKWETADGTHRLLRDRWDRLNALYHSRRDFLRSMTDASSSSEKAGIIDDARKAFGDDLLIPYAFSVVETVLPRLLSNRPKMLWTPKDEQSAANVENVRIIVDGQQQQCNYELKLQTTGRSGLIYGLGVQKVAWRKEVVTRKVLKKRAFLPGYAQAEQEVVLWDDPDVQDVSIYDFRWDPYGDNMETIGWAFHRTWRSTRYVLAKIASGDWPDVSLEAGDLQGQNANQAYDDAWRSRRSDQQPVGSSREPIHEVWEFHDGDRVVTVLNRTWPVADIPNPAWHGRMPFHIYRPTEVLHEFCGKGEIEPIEELSREMNWLRTDRRWNASMVMNRSYFFDEGTIDPKDIRIGPGMMNPVNAGGVPLSELLYPVQVGDIANSGYQEEAALQADIERVSGISDPVSGLGDASQTATGVQLVQAAAGLRIQNKTRRIEIELIKPEAEDWLALDQQRIVEAREIGVPAPPAPGAGRQPVWTWIRIGPEELAGRFAPEPDGGSTAPENVPQMRQDAQMLINLLQVQGVDQRKILTLALEKFGIKAPETYLAPAGQQVPPQTLDLIVQELTGQLGLDQGEATQIVSAALHAALDQQNGPQAGAQAPQSGPPQPPEQQAAA